jgi:hypothetical protein
MSDSILTASHADDALNQAIYLANIHGFAVFPVTPGSKAPACPNGCKDATNDPDKIVELWDGRRNFNVGIEAQRSRLIIVDVDAKGERNGHDRWRELCGLYGMPKTLTAQTPNGGLHYYLRCPDSVKLANLKDHPVIGDGIEIKCNNQYVVAPPSSISGKQYQWLDPSAEIADCPDWLIALNHKAAAVSVKPKKTPVLTAAPKPTGSGSYQYSAADVVAAYNSRNSVVDILARHGYTAGDSDTMMRHPNERSGSSVQINADNTSYHHGARDPLRGRGGGTDSCFFSPYGLIVELEHGGDRSAALRAISRSLNMHHKVGVDYSVDELGNWSVPPANNPLDRFKPRSIRELVRQHPVMKEVLIDQIMRVEEVGNLVAGTKLHKTYLIIDLAITMATGGKWLGEYQTKQGRVLILDNELHPETSADRYKKVGSHRGIPDDYMDNIDIVNLRGKGCTSIMDLRPMFDSITPGTYNLIILDAIYRFLPFDRGESENDGTVWLKLYNELDKLAKQLKCSFLLVHHTSKGDQSEKAITDLGSGSGSQSRATDNHLTLRSHEEDDCVVLDAALRSFPPLQTTGLRWNYPVWAIDHSLDVTKLRKAGRRKVDQQTQQPITPEGFVQKYVTKAAEQKIVILERASNDGIATRSAERLFSLARARKLINESNDSQDKRLHLYSR